MRRGTSSTGLGLLGVSFFLASGAPLGSVLAHVGLLRLEGGREDLQSLPRALVFLDGGGSDWVSIDCAHDHGTAKRNSINRAAQ